MNTIETKNKRRSHRTRRRNGILSISNKQRISMLVSVTLIMRYIFEQKFNLCHCRFIFVRAQKKKGKLFKRRIDQRHLSVNFAFINEIFHYLAR